MSNRALKKMIMVCFALVFAVSFVAVFRVQSPSAALLTWVVVIGSLYGFVFLWTTEEDR
jgi:hypothetical protein